MDLVATVSLLIVLTAYTAFVVDGSAHSSCSSKGEIAAHILWESSQWPSRQLESVSPATLDFSAFNDAMELASSELYGAGFHAFIFDAKGEQVLSRTYGRNFCGSVRWCEGFGDFEFTKHTQIPVFSISKIISAQVFLLSVGLRGLDEPLSESLPDFFSAESAAGSATPRMILSHTAGFQGILSDDVATRKREWLDSTDCFIRYENHYRFNASAMPEIDDDDALENCVRQISRLPLAAEPGTQFIYSDLSFEVLALILKTKTGMSFEEAFQQKLAAPLSLKNSSFVCEQTGSTAHSPHPSIGFCATSEDYAAIVRMLFLGGKDFESGETVVPSAVLRQIFSHQTGEANKIGVADAFFYEGVFGSRCVDSLAQKSSCVDYGLGAMHHFGFKSELWLHGSHSGSNFVIAPNRFAIFIGTHFPGGVSAVMPRTLRAIDAFERTNDFAVKGVAVNGQTVLEMCPTSIALQGDSVCNYCKDPPEFGDDGRLTKPNL